MVGLNVAELLSVLLLFGYFYSATLIYSSFRTRITWPNSVVPLLRLIAATIIMATGLIYYWSETIENVPSLFTAINTAGAGVAGIVLGMISADFTNFRTKSFARVLSDRLRSHQTFGTTRLNLRLSTEFALTFVVLAISTGLIIVAISKLEQFNSSSIEALTYSDRTHAGLSQEASGRVLAKFTLPFTPVALVTLPGDSERAYIASGEGEIILVNLPPNLQGNLSQRVVASGLENPRGLAMLEEQLFVSEQGSMPCESVLGCKPLSPEGEFELLNATRGRVVAFDILPRGELENKHTIVSNLPVVNRDHGVNGLTIGTDGYLYLSIGNIHQLVGFPELFESLDRPNLSLVGTVIRFRSDGTDLEVFVKGTRNIYELVFDGKGNIFAADNNGAAARGWRQTEILQLTPGADYGYPLMGTFDINRENPPIGITNFGPPVGTEWAGKVGLPPGLLVGTLGAIVYLPLEEDTSGAYLLNQTGVAAHHFPVFSPTSPIIGYFTAIAGDEEQRLWVTSLGVTFDPDLNALYILNLK